MKRRFFLAAALLAAAFQLNAQGARVLFQEDFSSNQKGWLNEKTDQYSFAVAEGKYYIHSGGGSWFATVPIDLPGSGDVEISFTVRKLSGTDAYYFGLCAGLDPQSGYFHFAGISGNGDFVLANKGADPADIIRSETNDFVRRGNSENTVVLRKQNGYFTLIINGKRAGIVRAQALYGSNIGFRLWSGSESLDIAVDSVTVRRL